MHGTTVTEVTLVDYSLRPPMPSERVGKTLQQDPFPSTSLGQSSITTHMKKSWTLPSFSLCCPRIRQGQLTVISWDCSKPTWFPWAPHIPGTGHKLFSLPPPEPCGCLLTFVESQNLILKQLYRGGLKNGCTWDFGKIGSELGRETKRKTGRPVSDGSSSLTWGVSEESYLERDIKRFSERCRIRLKVCEAAWRHFTHESF